MSHIIILIVIAVIVIPPEKLPGLARQVARFINDFRRSTSGLWDDIKKDAMVKPEDIFGTRNAPPKPQPPQETATQAEPAQTVKVEPKNDE